MLGVFSVREGTESTIEHRIGHSLLAMPGEQWCACHRFAIRSSPPTPGGLPTPLELEFLDAAFALVLNAERGVARHEDALARNQDGEALAALQGVGQSAQLGEEVLLRTNYLDVALKYFS